MVTHDPRYSSFAERQIQLFDGRIVEDQATAGMLGLAEQ
jgi:ABC-type lipoprotein export system ATPase subunit